MANPNPTQTDEFKEKRADTQFGGPNANPQAWDIEGANQARSISNELKYLLAHEFTEDDILVELARMRAPQSRKRTGAKIAAIRIYEKLYSKVPADLATVVMDRTEGKLVQKNQELPPPPPMPETFPTAEEAALAYARECKR